MAGRSFRLRAGVVPGINIENGEKLATAQYEATHPAVNVTLDPFDSQGSAAQAPAGANKWRPGTCLDAADPALSVG